MCVTEPAERGERGVVRVRECRVSRAFYGRTERARRCCEMAQEVAMVARHVGAHAREERRFRRDVSGRCRPAGGSGLQGRGRGWGWGVVDAEEHVECVNERALRCARAGELIREDELRVRVEAVEVPCARARVGAIEPGADGMVEDVGVAAITDGKEEARDVVENAGEDVEIARNAVGGELVADEELIHRRAHDLECINAAQLDARAGEIELFLVSRACKQRETAQVVERWPWLRRWNFEGPIVEHVVRVGHHGGELQLRTDLQKRDSDRRGNPDLSVRWQGVYIEVHDPCQYVVRTAQKQL